MLLPLFVMKRDKEYYRVVPKISKEDKTCSPSNFIALVAEKFKNVPNNLAKKEAGFLTVAGYIMLEILHKINPGVSIDALTNVQSQQEVNVNLEQAMLLFATGIKIGQRFPKGVKIEEHVSRISVWDTE